MFNIEKLLHLPENVGYLQGELLSYFQRMQYDCWAKNSNENKFGISPLIHLLLMLSLLTLLILMKSLDPG